MFNKEKFSEILIKIISNYESISDFSVRANVGRSYISKYINQKIDNPPTPKVLEKIANSSNNTITTYEELMSICGYTEETLENIVYNIYLELKRYEDFIHKNDTKSHYQAGDSIDTFQNYLNDLILTLQYQNVESIYLDDYYKKDFFLEDYSYVSGFMCLYDSFLKNLKINNYITIIKYHFNNWFDMDNIYSSLDNLEDLELLSSNCSNISIKEQDSYTFVQYIKEFSKCLNLSFLSDFDNNALTEIFKKKVNKNLLLKDLSSEEINNKAKTIENYMVDNNISVLFNIPILGKIAAGQPILAEQYIEGYLPVDPNIYGMSTPEEYFYLKVNGESMNLKIHNGDYALIHKQDYAEDGNIVVAIVNGDEEATLKRYKRINEEIVMLEPMSTLPMEPLVISLKETPFKIIGKAIGQFGKF